MTPSTRSVTSHWIYSMGLLASLLAACTGASAQWSRQSPQQVDLGGHAHISLPKGFMLDVTDTTPDFNEYQFRKTYKSHLNGQTSYSEHMDIVLFASDYPRERFDEDLASGRTGLLGRSPGPGEPDGKGMRWKVREIMYDRDPVHEPSWNVRVDDRARGVVVTWRGFKKEYTLEQAKQNLAEFMGNLAITNESLADFTARRSWSASGWQQAYEANLRVAKTVLAEKQLVLGGTDSITRTGMWRIYLDSERPQQLHVMHQLAALAVPDGPFRLTAQVTSYKYQQQHWYQNNQGNGSGLLPSKAQVALATDFTDQQKIYFYQIKGIDMWKSYASEKEFGDMLREVLRKMEAGHVRLLRDGFIGGDAEP